MIPGLDTPRLLRVIGSTPVTRDGDLPLEAIRLQRLQTLLLLGVYLNTRTRKGPRTATYKANLEAIDAEINAALWPADPGEAK